MPFIYPQFFFTTFYIFICAPAVSNKFLFWLESICCYILIICFGSIKVSRISYSFRSREEVKISLD